MQSKSRVLRRINLLYTLFFAAIVLAIVSTVLGDEFRTGFRDGQRAGIMGDQAPALLYGVANRTSALDYDIPLTSLQPGVETNAKIEKFSVQITGLPSASFFSWEMITALLAQLCYAFIFVQIFIILNSLRRSFRSGNVFERRIIRLTKTIAKMLVVASVFGSTSQWITNRAAAKLITPGDGFIVNTQFDFSHSQIIMAILILFIAEIFAIGYDLMEEQKLTI